jgi:branched-subunit amino acid aminotransferase/4-amino-4-deoxychorismate lyase
VHAADPGASALLLDVNGHVTETAGANFLAVRGGVLLSPPRELVLGGISLRTVEELCHRLGIPFEERRFRLEDCLTADEAMLATTPYCLAGVCRIDNTPIPWPGPIFQRLLAAWSDLVGVDVSGQILCAA